MAARLTVGFILLFIFTGRPVPVHAAESRTVSLQALRQPCSLGKVVPLLARQFKTRVAIDPSLANFRVVWAYQTDLPLETLLARLAELTSSRLVASTGASGQKRFSLEPRLATRERERTWRRQSLARSIRELLRAVDQEQQGKLDTASFASNIQSYLQRGQTKEWQLLRYLTPQQFDLLVEGQPVRLLPGVVPDAQIYALLTRARPSDDPDDSPEEVQRFLDREFQAAQQKGLNLQIKTDHRLSFCPLMLDFGGSLGRFLCNLGDAELGLPLTRTNPYRFLENTGQPVPTPQLPAAFDQVLKKEVLLPPDGRWEAALAEVARVAGVDLVSDAYLCRVSSQIEVPAGMKRVLLPRGIPVAQALDQLCRAYEYLWWQKDGCVYLRARAWPWDLPHEPPDWFLDRWSTVLRRGQSLGAPEVVSAAALTPEQLVGLEILGGRPFAPEAGRNSSAFREFLQFFPACSALQQQQLLGRGLPIEPRRAASTTALLQPFRWAKPDGTVTLQLRQKVTANTQKIPPTLRVTLTMVRCWEDETSELLDTIELPQLAPPFAMAERTVQ
jgi:hypothetical protein